MVQFTCTYAEFQWAQTRARARFRGGRGEIIGKGDKRDAGAVGEANWIMAQISLMSAASPSPRNISKTLMHLRHI